MLLYNNFNGVWVRIYRKHLKKTGSLTETIVMSFIKTETKIYEAYKRVDKSVTRHQLPWFH